MSDVIYERPLKCKVFIFNFQSHIGSCSWWFQPGQCFCHSGQKYCPWIELVVVAVFAVVVVVLVQGSGVLPEVIRIQVTVVQSQHVAAVVVVVRVVVVVVVVAALF